MRTYAEKKTFCHDLLQRGFRMSITEMNHVIDILSNHIDFNKIVKHNFLTIRINNINKLVKGEEPIMGFFIVLRDGTKHHLDYNFACMSKNAQEKIRKKDAKNNAIKSR